MRCLHALALTSAVSVAVTGALTAAPVAGQEQGADARAGGSRRAVNVTLIAGPSVGHSYVPPVTTVRARAAAGATIEVTYHGFTRRAKRAFQHAVDLWEAQISSPVTITVDATFADLGPGILGSAGPSLIWRDFRGAPRAGTWYVDAIANKHRGRDLDPSADIVAEFNSGFSNWYYATDGATPADKYDFVSVVMHEIGHGLGFMGAGFVSGSQGSVRWGGYPTGYDHFTETKKGRQLLNFPDGSSQLATALQSNRVFFDSKAVRNANAGNRAKIYAPTTWQQGSSYSHLDELTFAAGNKHSLMTPQLGSGEAIHRPGAITKAIFKNIGW